MIDILCNERCSKCNHWKFDSQKKVDSIRTITDFVNQIETIDEFIIVGGEPLIYRREIIEIISNISKKIRVTVITNGVLADRKFIDSIKSKNTHLIFSIDTLDKQFWKFVRGKDTFDIVMKNFEYARLNLDPIQLSVQSVLSKETADHVNNVSRWLEPLGIYHSIQDYISEGFDGNWTEIVQKRVKISEPCIAHKYNMSIMPNGDVYTCFQQNQINECMSPVGNVKINTFSEIIESKYLQFVIEKMKKCSLPCKVLKCNIEGNEIIA